MIEISLGAVLVGIGVCCVISLAKERWLTFLFSIIAIVGYCSLFVLSGENIFLAEKLSKEVNLQQVSVKGQNVFNSQISLVYKDGKLDKITLVPNTTTPEVAKK